MTQSVVVVGKMRHMSLRCLFLSDLCQQGLIKAVEIPGVDNPSDVMAKYVDQQTRARLLKLLAAESKWEETVRSEGVKRSKAKGGSESAETENDPDE